MEESNSHVVFCHNKWRSFMCLDFCLRMLADVLADGMLKPKNELRKSQGLGSVLRWPHDAGGMLIFKNELKLVKTQE